MVKRCKHEDLTTLAQSIPEGLIGNREYTRLIKCYGCGNTYFEDRIMGKPDWKDSSLYQCNLSENELVEIVDSSEGFVEIPM